MCLAGSDARAAQEAFTLAAANLHACASTRCAKIGTIPPRTLIYVYYCGAWCQVDVGVTHGYVPAQFVSLEGAWPGTPPTIVAPRLPPPRYEYFPWWGFPQSSWHNW
jgi:hypothetical protein